MTNDPPAGSSGESGKCHAFHSTSAVSHTGRLNSTGAPGTKFFIKDSNAIVVSVSTSTRSTEHVGTYVCGGAGPSKSSVVFIFTTVFTNASEAVTWFISSRT